MNELYTFLTPILTDWQAIKQDPDMFGIFFDLNFIPIDFMLQSHGLYWWWYWFEIKDFLLSMAMVKLF